MSKTVLIPISDGVEEIEAVTIIDTLRRAGAEVTVASIQDDLTVTASRGVKLVADTLIGNCVGNVYDLIALPGGLPGSEHLRDCADLTGMLKTQEKAGRLFAAICAAPAVVLAHHGLIKQRKATCYPSLVDKLGENGTSQERVVVDGNCITSQGPGSALEFALKLIEVLIGESSYLEVAGAMLAKP